MATRRSKKAKGNVTALKANPGILNTLESEHEEISAIMNQILTSTDGEGRADNYRELRKQLLLHAQAEQQVFYARCEEIAETVELVREGLSEHEDMERLIETLDGLPVDAPAWLETVRELADIVEAHVEEEEGELFPICKDVMDRRELRDLDDAYDELKMDLETEIAEWEPGSFRPAPREIG